MRTWILNLRVQYPGQVSGLLVRYCIDYPSVYHTQLIPSRKLVLNKEQNEQAIKLKGAQTIDDLVPFRSIQF